MTDPASSVNAVQELIRYVTRWPQDASFGPRGLSMSMVLPLLATGILASVLALAVGVARVRGRSLRTAQAQMFPQSPSYLIYWAAIVPIAALLYAVDSSALLDRAVAPAGAMVVRALATKRGWRFTYANDATVAGELTIPVGQPVKLVLSSSTHPCGFQIPEFGVSSIAQHGSYSSLWFTVGAPGRYRIRCGTSCPAETGLRSAGNWLDGSTTLVAVADVEFQAWLVARSADKHPDATASRSPK